MNKSKYLCLRLERNVNLKSLYQQLKSKLFNDNNLSHPHDLETESIKSYVWQDLAKILLIADRSWMERPEFYRKYNVVKYKETELIKMEKLEKIFELQKEFQNLLGDNIPIYLKDVILKENVELIKNQILALFDEVSEALREVPWKPWKENQDFNVSKFKMELIDVFHFLINLFLLSGMNAQEVFDLFLRKNTINRRRQKNGY